MGKITRKELTVSLQNELQSVFDYVEGSEQGEISASLSTHIASKNNPHSVTKAQVGLGSISDGLQSTTESHIANKSNPHNVNHTHVGAPPTSRTISTGSGLKGGGSLASNRSLSLDLSYTDGRYMRKSGNQTINGHVMVNGGLTVRGNNGEYLFTNAIDSNDRGTHMYLRPNVGGEMRVTQKGGTTKWLPMRAQSFKNKNNRLAYHKYDDISWGTGNPRGGTTGDIYIKY